MKDILQRLAEGPIVGDGSMCMTLEKRGYCMGTGTFWWKDAVANAMFVPLLCPR